MHISFEQKDIEQIANIVSDIILRKLESRVNIAKYTEDEFLNIEEAAKFLGTSKSQIYQWVNKSRHQQLGFPFMKAGRSLRFSKANLLAWLQDHGKPNNKK